MPRVSVFNSYGRIGLHFIKDTVSCSEYNETNLRLLHLLVLRV